MQVKAAKSEHELAVATVEHRAQAIAELLASIVPVNQYHVDTFTKCAKVYGFDWRKRRKLAPPIRERMKEFRVATGWNRSIRDAGFLAHEIIDVASPESPQPQQTPDKELPGAELERELGRIESSNSGALPFIPLKTAFAMLSKPMSKKEIAKRWETDEATLEGDIEAGLIVLHDVGSQRFQVELTDANRKFFDSPQPGSTVLAGNHLAKPSNEPAQSDPLGESEASKVVEEFKSRFQPFMPGWPRPGIGPPMDDPKERAAYHQLVSEYNAAMRNAERIDIAMRQQKSRQAMEQAERDGNGPQLKAVLLAVENAMRAVHPAEQAKRPETKIPTEQGISAERHSVKHDAVAMDTSTRKSVGRLSKAESELKRTTMLATLRAHPTLGDAPAELAGMAGVSERTVRRWLATERQKYLDSKAANAPSDED